MSESFKTVWISRLISILGTELTSFGVSVWVYHATGKATPMALTLLCAILPAIIFGPMSGIICDRYNRKKVILIADSFAALFSFFLLIYIKFFDFHFSIICLFVFGSSIANTFDNNAYQASITTLVKTDEIKKANGMNQMMDSLGTIASPVLAGILYPLIGLSGIIIVDLLTYVVSLLIFIRVDKNKFSSCEKSRPKAGNTRKEIWEGFSFILSNRSLLSLLIYFTFLNFLFNISTSLLEPLGLTIGNSVQLGVIKACGGIGVLCGSLFATTYNFHVPFYKVILTGGLLAGVALVFTVSMPNFICVALGRLIFSSIVPVMSTLTGTLWMKKTPQDLQGRVFATKAMILRCFMPLSYLVVGPLVDSWLPHLFTYASFTVTNLLVYRFVFLCVGVCVILLTLIVSGNKAFKRLV